MALALLIQNLFVGLSSVFGLKFMSVWKVCFVWFIELRFRQVGRNITTLFDNIIDY
jgi:hypothetical protein